MLQLTACAGAANDSAGSVVRNPPEVLRVLAFFGLRAKFLRDIEATGQGALHGLVL